MSIKYVTPEGVREGVTVCDREWGPPSKSMLRYNLKNFIHMIPKIESDV